MKKPLLIALVVVAIAGGGGGYLYWKSQNFAETDNAFVSGHVHPVSARIGGVVTRVEVEDNASVSRGQALLQLDPADQQLAIEKLKAQRLQIEAQISAAQAQAGQAKAQVNAAQAQVIQAKALLTRQQQDVTRTEELFNGPLRILPKERLDAAVAGRDAQAADVTARTAAVHSSQQQVLSTQAQVVAAQAQLGVLAAQIQEAEQQLRYTAIAAPAAGRIGKRTVEVGQRVQPGQQLLAVVQGGVWLTANFKETQLARMKLQQAATVTIDAFPGRVFHAQVQSFSPASGAQFALLPPDNATGNFTRVVQRVPVRLKLDDKEMAEVKEKLVPGLSAKVSVDLRS
jgi:membrane fusion protein (multidrug efflux system)